MRLATALFALFVSIACQSPSKEGSGQPADAPGASVEALPPLELDDETSNLLLTWVSEDGNFHVTESISEIPPDRRQRVRVVVTGNGAGTGQTVYVANLSEKLPSGKYPVGTLSRADWEKLGADLRETRIEALAPGAPPREPAAEAEAHDSAPAVDASGEVKAIVYGADWCKPCHDAQELLESLGVSVTKKDIEQSRAARAEMQAKLARVNRSGASIPVIDVAGSIFVGYSREALERAVARARKNPS